MTHICVSGSVIIGSGNGLSPVLHHAQPITWTNAAFFVSWNIKNIFQWIYNPNSNIFIKESAFENAILYLIMKSSNGWVKQEYVVKLFDINFVTSYYMTINVRSITIYMVIDCRSYDVFMYLSTIIMLFNHCIICTLCSLYNFLCVTDMELISPVGFLAPYAPDAVILLTLWNQVNPYSNWINHRWFWLGFVACSVPSHGQPQWWLNVNWTYCKC